MKQHEAMDWPVWPQLGEAEQAAVKRVVSSNQLYAAEEVRRFETLFKEYVGTSHALGCGNATQGLHMALAALDVGVGDEVIVPPISWISTASCVLMQNAIPVFADCEPESLGLDPLAVEAKITPRTKAIIPVHLFGYPCDMNGLMAVAQKHGIQVVEDASHAHGAYSHGMRVGGIGDIGVFSLHQRKNLCVGDGGMVVTNDDDVADKIYRLRSFGHDELSYNYRMTEFAAAIGSARITRLDEDNRARAENAERMGRLLEDCPHLRVRKPRPGTTCVYHSMLIELHPESNIPLSAFANAMNAHGVPCNKIYDPLHRHSHFHPEKDPARGVPWRAPFNTAPFDESVEYADVHFPVSVEYCDNRILELPVHPPVGGDHIEKAHALIRHELDSAGASHTG
jgi:dTDP-4-amino-4,6-dideoxygalactose transaminase